MNRTSTHYTDAVEKYLTLLMKNFFASNPIAGQARSHATRFATWATAWERACPAIVCQRNTVKRPNSVCRENPSTLPSESSACSGSATGKLPLTLRCASSPSSSTIRPG